MIAGWSAVCIFARMKSVYIEISRADVYEEVKKTTSYASSKVQGDSNAYERTFVKDADEEMLERFFYEACTTVTNALKAFVTEDALTSYGYNVTLTMPETYNEQLTSSLEKSIESYLELSILVSWYLMAQPDKVETTAASATAMLDDIRRKVYHRIPMPRPGA